MLTAFPYDCHKFVNCTGGHFVAVETVHNNNVYNPADGTQREPTSLACAVVVGK